MKMPYIVPAGTLSRSGIRIIGRFQFEMADTFGQPGNVEMRPIKWPKPKTNAETIQ